MAKYIDADRLRAEIERRMNAYAGDSLSLGCTTAMDGFEPVLNIIDSIQLEEPIPNDLEEAAVNWICNHKNGEVLYVKDAFIAGAKWQAEQLLKSSPLPEDTVLFNKGVEEGKRLMMEEAMEGEVMTNGFYPYEPRIVAPYPNCPYDFGDKVRVIVLPKECEK